MYILCYALVYVVKYTHSATVWDNILPYDKCSPYKSNRHNLISLQRNLQVWLSFDADPHYKGLYCTLCNTSPHVNIRKVNHHPTNYKKKNPGLLRIFVWHICQTTEVFHGIIKRVGIKKFHIWGTALTPLLTSYPHPPKLLYVLYVFLII